MKRRIVRVVQCRMADVEVGDVVNRADDLNGWFVVASVTRLFNGKLQAADHTALQSVSGEDVDMVCVQFVSEIEVPDQPEIAMPAADQDDPADYETAEPEAATNPVERPSVPASLSGLAG